MRRFFILIFLFCLLAPALGFVLFGRSTPYGQRLLQELPALSAFINVEGRKAATEQLYDNSVVRRLLISARNTVLVRLSAVNDERMLSGRGDWLFYKEQFNFADCSLDVLAQPYLGQYVLFDRLAEVASRDGLEMVFAIAPNKYSLRADQASYLVRLLADCYERNKRIERDFLETLMVKRVIYHEDRLSRLPPSSLIFMPQDTHWTQAAGVAALADFSDLFPEQPALSLLPDLTPHPTKRKTDLGNVMLLLPGQGDSQSVDLTGLDGNISFADTAFVVDSFYGMLIPDIAKLLPDARLIGWHGIRDRKVLRKFDRIVLTRVERLARADKLLTTQRVGRRLFEGYLAASQKVCGDSDVHQLTLEGRRSIRRWEKAGDICVSVRLETTEFVWLTFYLEEFWKPDQGFSDSTFIRLPVQPGRYDWQFFFPKGRMGQSMQLSVPEESAARLWVGSPTPNGSR